MEILESSSSWIIALGKTLLNSLWLGLLLLSLLKVLYLLIPQRFAASRYQAALLTLLIFVTLTGGLFLLLYTPVQGGTFNAPIQGLGGSSGAMRIYHFISLSYLAGISIYFFITLAGLGKIRSIRLGAKPLRGPMTKLFEEFKTKAGVKSALEFLESEQIVSPFLTGVFKPAIVVPVSMLSQLSLSEIESIIMHELYHLKRLDHLVNPIQRLMELLFFFNPAVWILSGMISSEREKRCDDMVLRGNYAPLDYARALLQLSIQQSDPGYLASAATGSGKSELKNRIERILKPNTMKINYREKTNTLLIFLGGLAVMLLVSSFTSGFTISRYTDVPDEAIPASIGQVQADTLTQEEKDKILKEVEEAMADIDLEQMKRDVKESIEAMKEIDWEEMKNDIEEAKREVMVDIDWEEIKRDIEEAKLNVMEDIDWEEMKKEIDEAQLSATEAMKEIDWEEIRKEMEEVRVNIDLMLEDFQIDMDFDMDSDKDVDVELDVENQPPPGEKD